jgi:hypothetical protein
MARIASRALQRCEFFFSFRKKETSCIRFNTVGVGVLRAQRIIYVSARMYFPRKKGTYITMPSVLYNSDEAHVYK